MPWRFFVFCFDSSDQVLLAACVSESRIDRFTFQGQDTENAFVRPTKWFVIDEPFEAFDAQGKFPQGQRTLGRQTTLTQSAQVAGVAHASSACRALCVARTTSVFRESSARRLAARRGEQEVEDFQERFVRSTACHLSRLRRCCRDRSHHSRINMVVST